MTRTRHGLRLAAVRASDVLVEPVTWLWPGRLACGKLNFIAGDPDTGKTFLTLDIASRATKGDVWPDDPNPYAPAAGRCHRECRRRSGRHTRAAIAGDGSRPFACASCRTR